MWTLLTAARLIVEARGHEEALLGCSRRQSPLVWRKDRNHQWRELALDLLRKEGGREGERNRGEGGEKERRGCEKEEEEENMSIFDISL